MSVQHDHHDETSGNTKRVTQSLSLAVCTRNMEKECIQDRQGCFLLASKWMETTETQGTLIVLTETNE